MTRDLGPAARRDDMTAKGLWRDETLLDHFRCNVGSFPNKLAVIATRAEQGDEVQLTYGDLDRLSDQVAVGLARRGIGEGTWSLSNCRTGGNSRCCISPRSSSGRSPTR
jgi:non-ribosomal peptide synthetase component E (peptide arylation enzyme)